MFGECRLCKRDRCEDKKRSMINDIVLLDYNTNCDYLNTKSPISHAGLLKMYIEECYPETLSVAQAKLK